MCCGGACVSNRPTENCGSCGNDCMTNQPGNTYAACVDGQCVYTCLANFDDCDGDPATGCETHTDTDAAHCGGCDQPCGDGQLCQAGRCCTRCGPLCCPVGTRARGCNGRHPRCEPVR
jgi:hypothetical protein